MQHLLRSLHYVLVALLPACVLADEPIGGMPEGIDPAEWEGLWVHEESFGIDAMVAVVKVASRRRSQTQ
jgi:hypothetical protein